ncbi:MAG: hypothetical protein KZQ96_23535 [Candidatus Thiodiazotropha sp. (ex Lucinoma borealis)]|nr:hypothetical protein [Candidatus Thiodiazotropha sp. (ex Lucinoma borealis)]
MINTLNTTDYEIEIGDNAHCSKCHCCGQESLIGNGFVYSNGDAYAVYYVGWSEAHPEKRVSFALAIGEWDDDSTSSNRICFGIEAYEGENEILCEVINPKDSPWPSTDLLGNMLTREDALKHPLLKEAFVILEKILCEHPAIISYLNM